MKQNAQVAFLVYAPMRQRRKDNSFDGNDNIGAKVIEAVLAKHNIDVAYCPPELAHKYQLILVSLTSTHDVFAFYQAVALHQNWQPGKRSFKVLAGGFGMQNPTAIRNYVDYAAFGRAHDWIGPVVDAILGGNIPSSHPSLMFLPDLHEVSINQAPLIDFSLEGKTPYGDRFTETFTGCPLKCKFCHYTFGRKYDDNRETRGSYVQESLTGGGTPELTFDQLYTWGKKLGRVRVAIDGFSSRLRWIYGKKISDNDIVGGIEVVGKYTGNTVMLVYNIANFPTEGEIDRQELYNALKSANPQNRVVFVLHSTPFRPSIATPMQWEGVTLFPDWSKYRSSVITETSTFRAVHSFTLETPYSHFASVVAERATPETDKLFHTMVFSKGLNSARHDARLKAISKEFDISPYIKQYEIDENLPSWFVSSFTSLDVLKKMARKMRNDANNKDYVPKGKSIVSVALGRWHDMTGLDPVLLS